MAGSLTNWSVRATRRFRIGLATSASWPKPSRYCTPVRPLGAWSSAPRHQTQQRHHRPPTWSGPRRLRAPSGRRAILTEIPAWTGPYLAPEVHMDKTRTSRASDMWALAGTAFFALTGEHPSPGEPDRMRGQLLEHLFGPGRTARTGRRSHDVRAGRDAGTPSDEPGGLVEEIGLGSW